MTLLFAAPEVLAALELEAGEVDTRVVIALAMGVRPGTGTTLVRAGPGIDPSTGEPWARRCHYDFALSVSQSYYSTAFAAALAAGDGPTADAIRQDVVDAAASRVARGGRGPAGKGPEGGPPAHVGRADARVTSRRRGGCSG